ncbi:MAG: superoxide dismutase [Dehalococcoidales bacterium]|nr:superoxide dismutase [Dehalococcoidales bacterium]
MAEGPYTLPGLIYGYADLIPFLSIDQLRLHHIKHHQAYVNGANAIMEKLGKARKEGADLDMKAIDKELSFHLGGHKLHSMFWRNIAPVGKGGGGDPTGKFAEAITREYGSVERFKKEFTQAAVSTEGSGWAAVIYDVDTERPAIVQIEKHNVNFPAGYPVLLVLDVWEHAYYLDYQNDRAKYVDAFWNIVYWGKANERLEALPKGLI